MMWLPFLTPEGCAQTDLSLALSNQLFFQRPYQAPCRYSPDLPNVNNCYGLGVSTFLTFVTQSALLVETLSETSVTSFP